MNDLTAEDKRDFALIGVCFLLLIVLLFYLASPLLAPDTFAAESARMLAFCAEHHTASGETDGAGVARCLSANGYGLSKNAVGITP